MADAVAVGEIFGARGVGGGVCRWGVFVVADCALVVCVVFVGDEWVAFGRVSGEPYGGAVVVEEVISVDGVVSAIVVEFRRALVFCQPLGADLHASTVTVFDA